jgi:DNA polymerase-3 subunit alpha
LDGAAKVKDIVRTVVEDGAPAVAITDHGCMGGMVELAKECEEHGITPIFGEEVYQAKESVDERPKRKTKSQDDGGGEDERGQKLYYHLTTLAETQEGYQNLLKLSSEAFLRGHFMKPRCDWEMLERYAKGLIATTGCLGGQVLQALLRGEEAEARRVAGRLQDIFGKSNLFVELQNHGIEEQRRTMPALLEVARHIDAPLVAGTDSHYCRREDAAAHSALLAIQTGSKLSDPNRFHFEGEEHYIKTAAEMREIFRDYPEACNNTLWIAERCQARMPFGDLHLPKFDVPWGYADDNEYLRKMAEAGALERWGSISEVQRARLDQELAGIAATGFASYFLILWDLCKFARSEGIRIGFGRGSAASSAVLYCLRVTGLDPLLYGLPFESFLNPERASMPDVDLDMDTRGRDRMISYVAQKYGEDRVAQVITFSKIKARSAVRDAARVMDKPYAVGDRISKAMPPLLMGRDVSLEECFDPLSERYHEAQDLRSLYESDPDSREVIETARGLEGLRRQDGVHAAAVVISDAPLTNYLPLQRRYPKGKPGPITTQYDMYGVEDLGLLKMDFLGVRNLDTVEDTLRLISEVRGVQVDLDQIPLDDPKTYEMIREGYTIGVFQVEGKQMRALIQRLGPTEFADLAALIALYRPGPMSANMHYDYADRKNGRQMITSFHPEAEELLADTYGLMIYQEQVMEVAQHFAGYTFGQADMLRRAIGKKLPEKMALERERFISGCELKGYGSDFGSQLFSTIERFADYSFRKCLTGDTPISYPEGELTIDEIGEHLARGEEVYLTAFQNDVLVSDQCTEVIDAGVQEVFRVTFDDGTSIEATLDHKFLCEDGLYHTLCDIMDNDLEMVTT